MTAVVIPFHSGDQFSAQLLIENILSFDSGMDDRLLFRLQFDRPKSECQILDSVERLSRRFSVEFEETLPEVQVEPTFKTNDPNSTKIDEMHTVRSPEVKDRILSWNRAVYAAIQTLDRFVIIEPDCIILKDNWADDIFAAAQKGLANFPIFGHLKTGLIGGQDIATHFAGCSVYDGQALRQLITDEVFQNRYPNPWWKLRHNNPTERAGNCFWGPQFSGYDISFDYFLYAHLQRDIHAHDRPLDWGLDHLVDGQDIILCDFHSRKTIDEILGKYFGHQPVIHGIKDDAVRHAVIKRARQGMMHPGFSLSGKTLTPAYARDRQALDVQVAPQCPSEIGEHNDRFVTLDGLRDKYRGERVFLIANGPSLKRTDLSRLKNEYTIGLNRIGLNVDNMGFEPTFLCCVNANVLEQFREDFERSSSIKFLSDKAANAIENSWNTFFMGSLPKVGYFEKDLRNGAWCEGWTVTYCAMQVAYYLGFKEVILVGLDHYFKDSGAANKAVVANSDDENHFHPAYFGKGVTWQYPDLDRSEQHYVVARQTFEEDGRRIIDATLGGHCEIFDKTDYDGLFEKARIGVEVKNPKVSVIIPFWNEEKYIIEAINSVLQDGLADVEVICVDDNSTDSSPAIVQAIAEKNELVRLISNGGRGVSDARNTGIAFARGEYVAFLDADDVFVRGALTSRVKALDENEDWQMVHGHVEFTDEEGSSLGCGMGLPRSVTFEDASGMPAHFNTVMLRRSVAHDLTFPSGITNGEDWLAFAGFLRQGRESHFVPNEGGIATYRVHPESTVLKDYAQHEANLSLVLDWVFSPASEEGFDPRFQDGLDPVQLREIKERRAATVLFWQILQGNSEGALAAAKQLIDSELHRGQGWGGLAPSLEIVGVRSLALHKDQLKRADTVMLQAPLSAASEILGQGLRAPFEAVFGILPEVSATVPERSRADQAGVDETEVVAHLLRDRLGHRHTMLDVGAHIGTSAQFFHKLDWGIHCFEPDPKNRSSLLERFRDADNVIIDTRAVSDQPATGVQFFTSSQSTGISGLHAFHETHAETGLVDITTLRDVIAERRIRSVDFLKIDVEGFDLNVLKGVPWDVLRPDVIECEFEDAKTLSLGHNWKTIADFLQSKGYAVYVSEWHPIKRYGIPHDWRRLFKYPHLDMSEDAWGNLLAFKIDPGYEQVSAAFSAVMQYRGKGAAVSKTDAVVTPERKNTFNKGNEDNPVLEEESTIQSSNTDVKDGLLRSGVEMLKKTPGFESEMLDQSPSAFDAGSPGNAWYSAMAHRIRRVSPRAFSFLRFCRRSIVHLFSNPLLLVFLVGACVGLIWVASAPAMAASRVEMLLIGGGALLIALLVYVAHRAQYHAERLYLQSSQLKREVNSLEGRLAHARILIANEARVEMERHVDSVLNEDILPNVSNEIDVTLNRLKQKNLAQHQDIAHSIDKITQTVSNLNDLQSSSAAAIRAEMEDLTTQLIERANALAALKDDFADVRDGMTELRRNLSATANDQEEVSRALTTVENSVANVEADLAAQLSEVSYAIDDKLGALSSALEQDVSKQVEEVQSDLREQASRLEEAIALKHDVSKQLEAVQSELKYQATKLEQSNVRIEEQSRWAMHDNATWFQHFNRKLSQEHINVFRSEWQKRLSVKITPQLLGYMASRACDIERQLDGRVATSIEDMMLRVNVAKAVKSKKLKILEIGTLFGTGGAIIYDAVKTQFEDVHLSLLDPLEGYYSATEPDISTGQMVNEATLRRNFATAGIAEDQYTLIKHLSTDLEAIELAGKKKYDLLIIDGDHSYAGVKADFENYARFVKLGGYIIFDDYGSPDWPDIQAYVDGELGNHPNISPVGSSWHTCIYRVVKAFPPKTTT